MTRTARMYVAARAPTKQLTKAPTTKASTKTPTKQPSAPPRLPATVPLRARYLSAPVCALTAARRAAPSLRRLAYEYAASGGCPPSRLERRVGAVTRTARVCVAAKAPTKQPTKAPTTKAPQGLDETAKCAPAPPRHPATPAPPRLHLPAMVPLRARLLVCSLLPCVCQRRRAAQLPSLRRLAHEYAASDGCPPSRLETGLISYQDDRMLSLIQLRQALLSYQNDHMLSLIELRQAFSRIRMTTCYPSRLLQGPLFRTTSTA